VAPRGTEAAASGGQPPRQDQRAGASGTGGSKLFPCSFHHFAERTSYYTGRPAVFGLAVLVVVVWAATGPLFGFSETWQLVINTGTTIITFLMVFLIQNTQNRDSHAVQLKLDELIHALAEADDEMLGIEDLEDSEIDRIHKRYQLLAENARRVMKDRSRPGTEPAARS
jgi:low affinity Fe/Cu permease